MGLSYLGSILPVLKTSRLLRFLLPFCQTKSCCDFTKSACVSGAALVMCWSLSRPQHRSKLENSKMHMGLSSAFDVNQALPLCTGSSGGGYSYCQVSMPLSNPWWLLVLLFRCGQIPGRPPTACPHLVDKHQWEVWPWTPCSVVWTCRLCLDDVLCLCRAAAMGRGLWHFAPGVWWFRGCAGMACCAWTTSPACHTWDQHMTSQQSL